METTTVLEIIRMLDVRIAQYEESPHRGDDDIFGAMWELTNLRNHLQEYIEAQVSYAENNLGNGE